jgi:folate-binding protein YgfZ
MLIDLSHTGLLQVAGQDAKKLLQGQLTCNLEEISTEQSRLGAHCNPQGRMLSLFRIFYFQDAYYLQMPAETLSEAIAALQKYAMFFKVKLADAGQLRSVAYHGEALEKYTPKLPQKTDDTILIDDVLIIKLPGENFYEMVGDATQLKKIAEALATETVPDSINAWKALHIAAGIPNLYTATIGKLLPHEINLQSINAVSFDKGCYTGQEIVARMHYRGQLKKHMYRARVKTTLLPEPGSDIYADTPCGKIVDSCHENAEYAQILVIANQADAESRQLFLDSAKIQPLEFLTLPY